MMGGKVLLLSVIKSLLKIESFSVIVRLSLDSEYSRYYLRTVEQKELGMY